MEWMLFDTDVISYGVKKDSRAALYLELTKNHVNCISFMSIAELELWSLRDGLGSAKLMDLRQRLQTMIPLQSTRKMARIWAEISRSVQKQGRQIGCADAWVAAAALTYNLPLVTHNSKDYASVPGLNLVSMNKK